MNNNRLLSTAQVAKILGISRIAIFKKIQSGEIKAEKIGRNYVIDRMEIDSILGLVLSQERKNTIERAVDKTVKEYGEALNMLGKE